MARWQVYAIDLLGHGLLAEDPPRVLAAVDEFPPLFQPGKRDVTLKSEKELHSLV
jgi:hypothetical protein